MKKELLVLSVASLLSVSAYSQTNSALSITKIQQITDIPATHSLDKKVLKEGEKTQKDLSHGKLAPQQAAFLEKNESNIAKELSDAKQDGKVTRTERKDIKEDINNNQDIRKDMKNSTKEAKKEEKKELKIEKELKNTLSKPPAPVAK